VARGANSSRRGRETGIPKRFRPPKRKVSERPTRNLFSIAAGVWAERVGGRRRTERDRVPCTYRRRANPLARRLDRDRPLQSGRETKKKRKSRSYAGCFCRGVPHRPTAAPWSAGRGRGAGDGFFKAARSKRERRAPRVAAQVEADDVDEGARRPGVVAWTRGRGQLL